MQKFIFKLESILRQKQWLEDESKRILGREMHKLNVLQSELGRLQSEHLQILETRSQTRDMTPAVHLQFIRYGNKLMADMENQREKIIRQEKVVKHKTKILNKAMVERKKMEKLQEREFSKYKTFTKRKESAITDETASNFTGRVNSKL